MRLTVVRGALSGSDQRATSMRWWAGFMSTHHFRATSRLLPGAALLAAAFMVVLAALREELSAPRVGAVLDRGLGRLSAHSSWIALYGVIALAVAAVVVAAAHRHRRTRGGGGNILPVAVAAGALWPLIVLGLTQVAALAGVQGLIAGTDAAGGSRQE